MAEILVLIDEPRLAENVIRELWKLGHSAWLAEDGFAAAQLLQRGFRASAYLVCEPSDTEGWYYFVQEKRLQDPQAPMRLLHAETVEEPGRLEELLNSVGLAARRPSKGGHPHRPMQPPRVS